MEFQISQMCLFVFSIFLSAPSETLKGNAGYFQNMDFFINLMFIRSQNNFIFRYFIIQYELAFILFHNFFGLKAKFLVILKLQHKNGRRHLKPTWRLVVGHFCKLFWANFGSFLGKTFWENHLLVNLLCGWFNKRQVALVNSRNWTLL